MPSYLYRCVKAHGLAGSEALDNFWDTSFLGDGTTGLREYVTRELAAVAHDVEAAVASGWNLEPADTVKLQRWLDAS